MENMVKLPNSEFWKNKKVFLTGHTGFKGGWLSLWLQKMGVELCGYSLLPVTEKNLFDIANVKKNMRSIIHDIRDLAHLQKAMEAFKPDIVIHMAAQPLVLHSYQHPIETYMVNVMGSAHVLEAARHIDSVRAVVNVTTDKCYQNNDWCWGYRENEPLGGYDPYSSSKACVELLTSAYRNSFYQSALKGLASARAGNVIGGGDWSPNRLVPDILRSCELNKAVILRYPNAIRPWQHVMEPLSGYLLLAESLYDSPNQFSQAWNFGPDHQDEKPVSWIVDKIYDYQESKLKWKTEDHENLHEANHLSLDSTKAKTLLGWKPRWHLDEALRAVVDWHQAWLNQQDMQACTIKQINTYTTPKLAS